MGGSTWGRIFFAAALQNNYEGQWFSCSIIECQPTQVEFKCVQVQAGSISLSGLISWNCYLGHISEKATVTLLRIETRKIVPINPLTVTPATVAD